MDHRRYPVDPADVIPLPTAPQPADNDASDAEAKLTAALIVAGREAIQAKLSAYVSATSRAARAYIHALTEMMLAARLGDDIRAAGIGLPVDPLGTAAALNDQLYRVARGAVEGGLVAVDDPVLAAIPWHPAFPGPAG